MHLPRVLIIDDSKLERYMLAHQLKQIGIEQVVEQSGTEPGLAYLQNCFENSSECATDLVPELIILDVNMPVMDGFEFLQKFTNLREKGKVKSCQILMYTGSDDPQEHRRALQYDVVKGILIKGDFEVQQLKDQINSLIYPDDTV